MNSTSKKNFFTSTSIVIPMLTFTICFLLVSQLSQAKTNLKTSKSVTVSTKILTDEGNCSIGQFEFCLYKIKSVTESDELAFASTNKQLKSACDRLQDGVRCADDHMRQCVSPGQWQLFEEVVAGTREVLVKLCVPGPVQRDYLRFSTCFKVVSKNESKCAKWLRKMQEMDVEMQNKQNIEDDSIEHALKSFCCAYSKAYECQVHYTRIDCGSEAVDFFVKHLNEISNSLLHRHCTSFSLGKNCLDQIKNEQQTRRNRINGTNLSWRSSQADTLNRIHTNLTPFLLQQTIYFIINWLILFQI